MRRAKKLLVCLFLIIICFLSILGYARFIEPDLLTVNSLEVETKKSIQPFKAVFFTDTHFGKYYNENHADKLVSKINQLDADIVVFGGDLLDNYARDREYMDLESLKNALKGIKAKAGKYAVWGNHDYGGGASRIYGDFMASCGFKVLKNENMILADYGIELVGYDDYLMGAPAPSLYKKDTSLYQLIVAHEPAVSQLIENEGENFLLCGHTHGGQVRIPFLTTKLLPPGSGKFVKGLYTAQEIGTSVSLQMYTSSGIGMTRYPFRFLNVPEIVEVNFKTSQ